MISMGTRVAFVLALCGAGFVLGCGDNDISGSCALCVNGVPVGPSASEAACQEWGETFGCAEVVLTNAGICGDSSMGEPSATCRVADCETAIEPCVL